MRIGLLADLHGNADAVKAVLSAADQQAVSLLLVAGDLVGYYYEAVEVLRLLSAWKWVGVRGNHESLFVSMRDQEADPDTYTPLYGSALSHWRASAVDSEWQVLTELPQTVRRSFGGVDFLIAHGAPWNSEEYIYPDAGPEVWGRLSACGSDVVVLGHTHHQFAREEGKCIILNPGSVGQPRDRRPGAPWILFDTASRSYTLRREQYDMSRLIKAVRERDPQLPYLEEVLVRT